MSYHELIRWGEPFVPGFQKESQNPLRVESVRKSNLRENRIFSILRDFGIPFEIREETVLFENRAPQRTPNSQTIG